MRLWIAKTDRERRETAGASARRMRLWIARLFLRSARAISTEVIDDLIASRGEEEYPAARSPFEPTGPPPHWLARVREGAPELLLSPEQGGTPRNSFAEFHPPDLNAGMTFTALSRLNPDAPRAPESERAPATPPPRRFTSTPGDTPAPPHLLHDAEPSPAAKRSFDTSADLRTPSVASKPLPRRDLPLSASTSAPHASSSRRQVQAPPVRLITNERRTQSTPIVNREQTSAAKGAPSREAAESLASRQSTSASTKPLKRWDRAQQLWWVPRKMTSDPVTPGPASATHPSPSLNQKSKEAHRNTPAAGEHEAAAAPSQTPFVGQWKSSVSPPSQRQVTLPRPSNLQRFGSNNSAKAQTSAEARSVLFSLPDDDFNRWPELLEEQSADGDEWSRALAESDHLRVLNREQRGGR
jgi:hypothetical protein